MHWLIQCCCYLPPWRGKDDISADATFWPSLEGRGPRVTRRRAAGSRDLSEGKKHWRCPDATPMQTANATLPRRKNGVCGKGRTRGFLWHACTIAYFKLDKRSPLPHPVCSWSTEKHCLSPSLSLCLSVSLSLSKSLKDLTGHCGKLKQKQVSWIQCWFWKQLSFCCLDDMFYINDWF